MDVGITRGDIDSAMEYLANEDNDFVCNLVKAAMRRRLRVVRPDYEEIAMVKAVRVAVEEELHPLLTAEGIDVHGNWRGQDYRWQHYPVAPWEGERLERVMFLARIRNNFPE